MAAAVVAVQPMAAAVAVVEISVVRAVVSAGAMPWVGYHQSLPPRKEALVAQQLETNVSLIPGHEWMRQSGSSPCWTMSSRRVPKIPSGGARSVLQKWWVTVHLGVGRVEREGEGEGE